MCLCTNGSTIDTGGGRMLEFPRNNNGATDRIRVGGCVAKDTHGFVGTHDSTRLGLLHRRHHHDDCEHQ